MAFARWLALGGGGFLVMMGVGFVVAPSAAAAPPCARGDVACEHGADGADTGQDPRSWDPAAANAGATPADVAASRTGLEGAILAETNLMRRDPWAYAAKLRRLRPYYEGALLSVPGETPILTREGVAALDEAIIALESTSPRAVLSWSEGLARAAADHASDLAASGHLGHHGSDGSQPAQRASRYGTWRDAMAENITFGSITAEDVVIDLLVDDGVGDRGHRRILFDPALRVSGVACAPHPSYRQTCVMKYAAGFDDAHPVATRAPALSPRAGSAPGPARPPRPAPPVDRIIEI